MTLNPNVLIANFINKPAIKSTVIVLARLLMAYIFIVAGWGKITGYAGTASFMESKGLSSALLPLVILLEFGGGLALLVGFQTRLVAFALGIFSIASAFLFHGTPQDATSFMKNIAMAGGYFAILASGAGCLSIDALLEKSNK